MSFNRLVVLPVPDEFKAELNFAARVFVGSDEPLRSSLLVEGVLGGQAIDGLAVESFGESLSGVVKALPQNGDNLKLAVDGDDLTDTGLTVELVADDPIV